MTVVLGMRPVVGFALFALSIGIAAPAALAESFVQAAAGGASTTDTDARVEFGSLHVKGEGDVDPVYVVEARAGHWLGSVPWLGFAGSVSYFEPEWKESNFVPSGDDFWVVPISLLVLARWPVGRSERYPGGRLFPYVAAGPGLFVSGVDGDFLDDESVELGADVRAGLDVSLTPWLGLFAEYRFTYFEPSYKDQVSGFVLKEDLEVATHHAVAGLGIRF